jgi:Tetratricopeptide repeat
LYRRALEGREEKLGPKYPDTLRTVQNLVIVYWSQGRYGEAERLFRRALEGREEKLGPKHRHLAENFLMYIELGKALIVMLISSISDVDWCYCKWVENRSRFRSSKSTWVGASGHKNQ